MQFAIGSNSKAFLAACLALLVDQGIRTLRASIVCGAANNQLAAPEDGTRLADAGVVYAPDYVVNAGGIINVAAEYLGWAAAEVGERVEQTAERLARVLDHAERRAVAPSVVADELAGAVLASDAGARHDRTASFDEIVRQLRTAGRLPIRASSCDCPRRFRLVGRPQAFDRHRKLRSWTIAGPFAGE